MRIVGIVVAVLLAGCSVLPERATVDQWEGSPLAALLVEYGPPSQTARISDDLSVVKYSRSEVVGTSGNVADRQCTALFYIDDREVVVDSRIEGSRGACRRLARVND